MLPVILHSRFSAVAVHVHHVTQTRSSHAYRCAPAACNNVTSYDCKKPHTFPHPHELPWTSSRQTEAISMAIYTL